MATITKTLAETSLSSSGGASTWTITASAKDMPISASTRFSREYGATMLGKYSPYAGKNGIEVIATVRYKIQYTDGTSSVFANERFGSAGNMVYLPADTNYAFPVDYSSYAGTIDIDRLFNSSNPTTRAMPINILVGQNISLTSGYLSGGVLGAPNGRYQSAEQIDWGVISNIVLNVPPTFDTTALSLDTSSAYSNVTTASVTVSNATAYYGGSISSATLTIGNQTASISGNGTISILLNSGGTFTPTVTVTDSRGQTATETLDPLTVNVYTAPSVAFTADRTNGTGNPDEEGRYGTVDATFTFSDVIATAVAPSVVVTDENGTQTTPTVTWYSSRATDGTLSGSVTWANLSSGDTVYGLIPNLNTEYSYQVSIRPRDNRGTGTAIVQTISSAFYTIDFLAGGHGIAFGQPASDVGFECNMPATLHDTVVADQTVTADNFLIDLSDYQTTGSVDKELYDAIVALGWDSDVLVS